VQDTGLDEGPGNLERGSGVGNGNTGGKRGEVVWEDAEGPLQETRFVGKEQTGEKRER
jgi:hypothetical protein